MSIVTWIVLGLIAGFIGSRVVDTRSDGILLDIALGIVGAVVGGSIFNAVGERGVTGFNLWSIFVAAVGAVVVLAIYHLLASPPRAASSR